MEMFLVNSDVNTTAKSTISMITLNNVRCLHMCRLGFIAFQLFYLSMCARLFWCVFVLADQRGIVCFPQSVRFEPPNVIENLNYYGKLKTKQQNVQILTNRCYKVVEG